MPQYVVMTGQQADSIPVEPVDPVARDPEAPPADPGARDGAPRERPTPEGDGLDPTRYGDWEKNGRCIDF